MKFHLLIVTHQISCYCGPKDGGKYDLGDACPKCGTGARRIDPIRLPVAKLKDKISITLKFEVVVPPRLVPPVRLIAPNCLREIFDDKTGVAAPFFQLIGERVLPRFGDATTGFITERQCPVCKRDGFFNRINTALKIGYENPAPSFLVAETYENFGNSRLESKFSQSLLAVPYLVIGEPLRNLFASESTVEFEPVIFEAQKSTASEPSH